MNILFWRRRKNVQKRTKNWYWVNPPQFQPLKERDHHTFGLSKSWNKLVAFSEPLSEWLILGLKLWVYEHTLRNSTMLKWRCALRLFFRRVDKGSASEAKTKRTQLRLYKFVFKTSCLTFYIKRDSMKPLPHLVDGGRWTGGSFPGRQVISSLSFGLGNSVNKQSCNNKNNFSSLQTASRFVFNQPKGGCVAPNFYRYNRRLVAGFWWTSKGRSRWR